MNLVIVDYGWCFDRFTKELGSKQIYGKQVIDVPAQLQIAMLTCLNKTIPKLTVSEQMIYLSIGLYLTIHKVFKEVIKRRPDLKSHEDQLTHVFSNTKLCISLLDNIEYLVKEVNFKELYDCLKEGNIPTWSSCCSYISDKLSKEILISLDIEEFK